MGRQQFDDLQVGPYTDEVKEAYRRLLVTKLLQFHGQLDKRYGLVGDLSEAQNRSQESHDDGETWVTLREHAGAYANGGGAFFEKQPWQSAKTAIRSFKSLFDNHLTATLPPHHEDLAEDVYGDIQSCFDCLIFRGSMDEFHAALWEAYIQGGWPCGWSGDIAEREDGSYDISRAVICVYWELS